MQTDRILNLLKKTGAIMDGHFLLTSGRHSNIYIEKFRILENPVALDKICKAMYSFVEDENIEIVLGAAIGGILIAGGLGRYLGVKHIFSERVNGLMELRRGFKIGNNQKVLIVEDIITTGGSVFELINLAEKNNADIVRILNIVDRSPKGINFEIPSNSLINIPSQSWEEKKCPLCKEGKEIKFLGRSGKTL